jgi:tetratricopeptide (TPR) repeat protein
MRAGCRNTILLLLLGGFLVLTLPKGVSGSRSRTEILWDIQQLMKQGNLPAAEQQLIEGLKLFPEDAAFYDLLGVIEAQKGAYVRAESDFLKAIELDPLLTGAYLNLGRLYQEHASQDHNASHKALATYKKLLKFDPQNTEANYQGALLLGRAKAFQSSLDQLSRLSAADQKKAQALSLRCTDLAGLRNRAATSASIDQLLNSPDLSEADVLATAAVLDDKHWDELEQRLLEGARAHGLAGITVLRALGRLYERTGKLDAARATLESAAQAQPRSVDILVDLAHIADSENDYKGALGYLAHARDLDPKSAAIHFFFGMMCVEENLLEEAYRALQQAVSLAPDNAYYNYAVGAVAQQRANAGEAIPYFKKYCILRPRDPRGRLQLGITYFRTHQDDQAQKELKDAAQHRETAAAAHFFLGRIANQNGAYSEALRELEQALTAEPNYANPYAEEGIIYMKQKAYAAAEKALRRALAIDPKHYAANLNLMMLYRRTGDKRSGEQTERFEEIRKKRAEGAKLSLRSIQIVR